ncbi:MAG: hypothetical protein LBC86_08675 [Oscillospiraceae bacterium]|jgi:hypothetical protein|nr:hypothetical protein [Oscillospiraceae bacterium]
MQDVFNLSARQWHGGKRRLPRKHFNVFNLISYTSLTDVNEFARAARGYTLEQQNNRPRFHNL